jgi:murein DD-endopeptidase MepM/ murein hydrolase activator NlpD
MAFVLIATGASSRSRVRALSVRPLILITAVAALVLLAAGGTLGYWLAVPQVLQITPLTAPEPPQASLPFTLEQLGAISGRLFRLESEAAQLSKRIGVLKKDSSPSSPREQSRKDATSSTEPAGASGGPLLPPRPESVMDLGALDVQLARVEQQIASVADAAAQRTLELMRLPTRLPIAGAELTSSFGNRTDPFAHTRAFHAGLDFAAERGTPIASAAGGTIVFAGFKSDFGWVVEIDHGNGLITRYAHASRLLVQIGQVVAPGDCIAMVGSTGRSTGPHLHFEVLKNGGHVDPRRYLAGL